MNIKDEKIKEYKSYIEGATIALNKSKLLYSALQTWNKKIVNKSFFEHYFTRTNEKGEVEKNYQGKIYTTFSFSEKAYEWEKYAKRIYIHKDYIEVQSTETIEVCRAVKEAIANFEERIQNYNAYITRLEAIDEDALVKDLLAVYRKHGNPEIWTQVLDSYAVKYPNEKN